MKSGKFPFFSPKLLGDPRFKPWRVSLFVQDHADIPDLRTVVYFVRASSDSKAAALADGLWQKWEKRDKGIPSHFAYPDTVDRAEMVALDEGDWLEYWQSACKFGKGVIWAGSKLHPTVWTCPDMNKIWEKDDLDQHLPEYYDETTPFTQSVL